MIPTHIFIFIFVWAVGLFIAWIVAVIKDGQDSK